ncbi:MAG TPA: endonuclease III domain-containing protein [bacterium]|nr:endonuclease III domain-containing protein [bacterium]
METPPSPSTAELMRIYELLLARFGPLHWWPGESPFEVMIGAILTQNTAWSNVVKAIANLKAAGLLDAEALLRADLRKLKRLIRPSGYFNQKAIKLRAYVRFFTREFGGSVERMAAVDTAELREKLLAVKGIGPETADSILLYALDKPVFVVDAYTRRAFSRLGFLPRDVDYDATREFFVSRLPVDVSLYNEYHAQIVYLGKDYCRTKPRCAECPLSVLGRCKID